MNGSDATTYIAGSGLPGSLSEPPHEPLSPDDWRYLLSQVRFEKIGGLLAAAVSAGAFPVTDAQWADVRDLHTEAMASVLLLERTMLDVVDLLQTQAIDVRVLKGSATAHLDYADPATRCFGDIDVLVRPEQYDAAVLTFEANGSRRMFREPRPGFDRRFGKANTFVMPNGVELDLHRTFVMGPFGLRVDLTQLWERSQSFVVGGRSLQALALEERFLHACYHAALGDVPPRLAPRRDIAEMLLFGRLDVSRVLDLTISWGAEPVVAEALRSTWDRLRLADVLALTTWAQAYTLTSRDVRELHAYLRPDNNYATKSIAAIRAIPRWSDRLAFVTSLVLPRRTYLEGRYPSRLRRLAYGLSSARSRNSA